MLKSEEQVLKVMEKVVKMMKDKEEEVKVMKDIYLYRRS